MRHLVNHPGDLPKLVHELTCEDLCWHYGTGQDHSIKEKGRDGRYHVKQSRYRHGVQTDVGDIRLDLWYELAQELVERNGEVWLLDALTDFYTKHGLNRRQYNPSKLNPSLQEALDSMMRRSYDHPDWWAFIPFNRYHRPQVLEGRTFVLAGKPCCGACEVLTPEQLAWKKDSWCHACKEKITWVIVREGPLERLE